MGSRFISQQDYEDEDIILDSFVDLLSCGLGSVVLLFLIFVTLPGGIQSIAVTPWTDFSRQSSVSTGAGANRQLNVFFIPRDEAGSAVLKNEPLARDLVRSRVDERGLSLTLPLRSACLAIAVTGDVWVAAEAAGRLAELEVPHSTDLALEVTASGNVRLRRGACP